MRSWVSLLILAVAAGFGASAARAEINPVATHPQDMPDSAVQQIIVKLRPAAPDATGGQPHAHVQARARLQALAARAGLTLDASHPITADLQVMQIEPVSTGQPLSATLAALRGDPDVEYAEADQRRYIHAVPNDAMFPQQWVLQTPSAATPSAVDALGAWDSATGDGGLVIADLDTGVRFEHPDLQRSGAGGRLLAGYDFISDAFVANDGDGRDADASDPGDWVTSSDLKQRACSAIQQTSNSSWHGTRTAGMLGALTDNGTGIAGMTWSASVLPVRVLGKCGGADSDILAGMLWAAGFHVEGVPDNTHPARIENMSLGATGPCPQSYRDVIAQLTSRGVIVVVSAGNDGGPVDSPANCPGVVGVAGLRQAGTKVGYSNLGPELALAAPAGNCGSDPSRCQYALDTTTNSGTTAPGDSSYTSSDLATANLGTSFSAPIVSGIAGLMLAVNGNLDTAQLIERMKRGSKPFPQSSVDAPAQPPLCHIPTGAHDVQNDECICTNDGRTCGAGMASASGALAEALRPIAAVRVSAARFAPGMTIALDASGSSAACGHAVASFEWSSSDPGTSPVTSTTGSTTTVTAPASGQIDLTLTVSDDAGRTDQAIISIGPWSANSTAPTQAGSTACLTPKAVPAAATSSSTTGGSATPSAAAAQTGGRGGGGALDWLTLLVIGGLAAAPASRRRPR
jgi:serine protease